MEIKFEKIPFEEYLAFFERNGELDSESQHWLKIQYDFLKEPSWLHDGCYELYCPTNFSIIAGHLIKIPTGYKCISDYKSAIIEPALKCIDVIPQSKRSLSNHIILDGKAKTNRCFNAGEILFKLMFE